jgi:hypothetical protein
VGSLGVVELVPLLVAQLGSVETTAGVRVASLGDLSVTDGGLVLLEEVFLHELFGEGLCSGLTSEEEADEEELQGQEGGDDEDVAVLLGN